jgi:drug/metabolite transporter (DMT)-like permease
MAITLTGIAISVLKRGGEGGKLKIKLQSRGLFFAACGALGQGLGIVLSKKGMLYYRAAAAGNETIEKSIPFSATLIRVIIGVIGFAAIIFLSGRGQQFVAGVRHRQGLAVTFGGSIFGPFIGVSLSLMAVLYTETGVASTILATTPILILLPYRLFYKQHITGWEVLGALISVVGVALFFL